jgi:hypothetical protein
MRSSRIIVAGYFIRCPLGGYAWQVVHYLLGLQALGYDTWFYEDTAYYDLAYNPHTDDLNTNYDAGITTLSTFFQQLGLGDRWVFVDTARGLEYGPGAGKVTALFHEADLLINLGDSNRIPLERRAGRPTIYIDLDPAYTQIKLTNGNDQLRAFLEEHQQLFTFGENIGTSRSPVPTGGMHWQPTRQPIAIDYWSQAGPPKETYTTVGRWDAQERTLSYQGESFRWNKRDEWLKCLELPARTGASFEVAMDVWRRSEDTALLMAHGWYVAHPLQVSTDPWRYREYLRTSRGEFTVAKDMNIRLRSGWFSDRAACYLAAGRPVVEQDTGFGDILPHGPGLHAFRTVDDAALAIQQIEADYAAASASATEVARTYFAAEVVLRTLLQRIGML